LKCHEDVIKLCNDVFNMKYMKFLLVFCLIQPPFCLAEFNELALLIESDEIIIQSLYQDVEYLDDGGAKTSIEQSTPIPIEHLPYQDEVNAAARTTNLAPALLHAIISTESGHHPNARSPKGAFGLMQLMPRTARAFKVGPYDKPDKQIFAGASYLKELLQHFHGDLTLALAAYNAGPATVEKYQNRIPPYAETQQYVRKVYRYLRAYSHHY